MRHRMAMIPMVMVTGKSFVTNDLSSSTFTASLNVRCDDPNDDNDNNNNNDDDDDDNNDDDNDDDDNDSGGDSNT